MKYVYKESYTSIEQDMKKGPAFIKENQYCFHNFLYTCLPTLTVCCWIPTCSNVSLRFVLASRYTAIVLIVCLSCSSISFPNKEHFIWTFTHFSSIIMGHINVLYIAAQKVHISAATNTALGELGGYYTEFREEMNIKVCTWLVETLMNVWTINNVFNRKGYTESCKRGHTHV